MKNIDLDSLLKQALLPTSEPSDELTQKVVRLLQDNKNVKQKVNPFFKKRIAAIPIAAALILVMSITVLAAIHFLSPNQVAEHFGDKLLAKAFEDKNAININKSADSGGYRFTLHGIVSGKDLSSFRISAQDINPDKTYAVVSITRQDGSAMPDTRDNDYGKTPFFVSPLIKGEKPWQVNIASMNGGYSECVLDGVMYRLIDCDGLEMFADRGLYLCISTSSFYDIKAFDYNDKTGEIHPKSGYKGANALFDLPLDKSKADPAKAEKYLEQLLNPAPEPKVNPKEAIDWEQQIAEGNLIPESVKEVTYDENGLACYEYNGNKTSFAVDSFFEKGQIGPSKNLSGSEDNYQRTAIQFSRDANGIITGRMFRLKKTEKQEIQSLR